MGKKRDRDSVSKEDAKRDPNAMDQDSSDDEVYLSLSLSLSLCL